LEDSLARWDCKSWEKESDWMALQGINLPLAFTVQETIGKKFSRCLSPIVFMLFHLSSGDFFFFFAYHHGNIRTSEIFVQVLSMILGS
jgi:alpha-N-acetylglucosaminidase